MSSPLSLSAADAAAKISQIEDASGQIHTTVNRVDETQQAMVAQTWHGASASKYIAHAAQQHEDLKTFLTNLDALVQKGVSDMHSFTAADNG